MVWKSNTWLGNNIGRPQSTWPIMGKHYILTSGHVPKQVLEVMVCSPWRQCWFMCQWCKRNCPQYSTMELVLSQHESKIYSLSVFLHDCRKKNHPFMAKQWLIDWTCFKRIIMCRLNRMHWKRLESSPAGAYGLCSQWGKWWSEFHSCNQ